MYLMYLCIFVSYFIIDCSSNKNGEIRSGIWMSEKLTSFSIFMTIETMVVVTC